jgi:outer membrane receptor protein involved in Fe transport
MKRTIKYSTAIYLVLAAGAAMAVPGAGRAQAVATAGDDGTIEELVITTRKRAELLQSVPMSVQAFGSADIERLGIDSVEDVAKFTPSIVFDMSANPESSAITIRGLSPSRGRANAAVLVDGIDTTTEAIGSAGGGMLLNTRLLDIERVEVARGPQAVEYGRSAFGGAIQYVTKDPSAAFTAEASLEVADHGLGDLSVAVSGPVVADKWGLRLGANAWTDDGYYKDQATLSTLGSGDGHGVYLSSLFTPSDAVRIKSRLEYFQSENAPEAQVIIRNNSGLLNASNNANLAVAIAAGVTSTASTAVWTGTVPDASEVGLPRHSPDPLTGRRFKGSERDIFRASNVISWDLGFGTITNWLGFTDGDFSNRQDSDQDAVLEGQPGSQIDTSSRMSVQSSTSKLRQYSGELRFTSDWSGPVQMTLGGLVWRERAQRAATTVSVTCARTVKGCEINPDPVFAGIDYNPDVTSRNTDHWSVYGSLDWAITDTLQFTAGARYADEHEEVTGPLCGLPVNRFGKVCGDPFATSSSTPSVFGPSSLLSDRKTVASAYSRYLNIPHDETFVTPQFTLKWTPREGRMFYASASKGVKPGGTSTVGAGAWFDSDLDGDTDELDYGAEKLWVYELGAKTAWFGNRVRTNVAVFKQQYTDKQVSSSIVTPSGLSSGVIVNAGAARTYGAEIEALWRITPRLQAGLGYTYLDSKYTEFDILTDTKSQIILSPGCTVVAATPPLCAIDLAGMELEKAPKHSAVFTLGYNAPAAWLGSGVDWYVDGDVSYMSRRYVDQSNARTLQSYALADLRFGFTGSRWDIGFYVDNVFNDDTIRSADTKTGDVDRVLLNLSASTSVIIVNLPEPRTFGVRVKLRN